MNLIRYPLASSQSTSNWNLLAYAEETEAVAPDLLRMVSPLDWLPKASKIAIVIAVVLMVVPLVENASDSLCECVPFLIVLEPKVNLYFLMIPKDLENDEAAGGVCRRLVVFNRYPADAMEANINSAHSPILLKRSSADVIFDWTFGRGSGWVASH
jgi:hypothetical protein